MALLELANHISIEFQACSMRENAHMKLLTYSKTYGWEGTGSKGEATVRVLLDEHVVKLLC